MKICFSGICMRRRDAFDRDALHFAPFLLLPSPFPRKDFENSLDLQLVLNELMHKGSFRKNLSPGPLNCVKWNTLFKLTSGNK